MPGQTFTLLVRPSTLSHLYPSSHFCSTFSVQNFGVEKKVVCSAGGICTVLQQAQPSVCVATLVYLFLIIVPQFQSKKMGSKAILENKSSLSNLISPVSPPTSACSSSDFSGFHLPPATTRIYPYSNFVGKNNTKFKQRRNRNGNNSSQHGLLSAFFWFALGTFISVLVIFIATQTLVLDLTSSSTKKHLCEQQPQGQEDNNLTDSASNGDKCFRVECLKAASRIMHRMDQTQQPCDDFYQFSCGRFIAHNEIPDDSFQRSTLQEMQESILVDIKSKYFG